MKIIENAVKANFLKDGKRVVAVELRNDEELIAIKRNGYYELGSQIDDIVYGETLLDSKEVYWNPIMQKWDRT
jgi:hypothetical protein